MKTIYSKMMELCYGAKYFQQYAGRGVVVCSEWKDDFKNFEKDMSPMQKGSTLARHDKNKGFNTTNCYWQTEGMPSTFIDKVIDDLKVERLGKETIKKIKPTEKRK